MHCRAAHFIGLPQVICLYESFFFFGHRLRYGAFSILMRVLSFSVRNTWYGPVTTSSFSDRPSRISISVVPVMPVLTGRNRALPSFRVKTPSFSTFFLLLVGSCLAASASN